MARKPTKPPAEDIPQQDTPPPARKTRNKAGGSPAPAPTTATAVASQKQPATTSKPSPKRTKAKSKPKAKARKTQVKKPPPLKNGKPFTYDPADRLMWVEAICERMERGETMVSICSDPQMPSYATVKVWQNEHPEAASRLAIAREAWVGVIDQRILAIVEDETRWEDIDEEVRQKTAANKWVSRRRMQRGSERAKAELRRLEKMQASIHNQRREAKEDRIRDEDMALKAQTNEALQAAAEAAARTGGEAPEVNLIVHNLITDEEENCGWDEDDDEE